MHYVHPKIKNYYDLPEGVVRVVLKTNAGSGVPLGVLLGEALFGVGTDLQLLSFPAHNMGFQIFSRHKKRRLFFS
jgi:hypothetical protein